MMQLVQTLQLPAQWPQLSLHQTDQPSRGSPVSLFASLEMILFLSSRVGMKERVHLGKKNHACYQRASLLSKPSFFLVNFRDRTCSS